MANYIATSCTDAYIKINNTSAKCGHHKAPASRVVSQKTRYLCIVMDFLLLSFLFIKHKKGGRNHKAKLISQSSAAAHSERSVSMLKGKGALCYCHSAQELSPALHFAAMG